MAERNGPGAGPMQGGDARTRGEAAAGGGDRLPVVLVPGAVGQDFVYWNLMQYRLERDGYPVYTLTFPRLTFADHRESANVLAEKVEEVLAGEGAPRVHLVAHSMGGLVSRYYLKVLGGGGNVDRLVCLGTPHHGTIAAYAGILLKGARQVRPGSGFLDRLNNGGGGHGAPVYNIASRFDTVVVPWRNALLHAPDARNRVLYWGGHWSLLVSPRVYGWVRQELEAATGAGRGDVAGHSSRSR